MTSGKRALPFLVVDMTDQAGCYTDVQRTNLPSKIFLMGHIYAADSLVLGQ